VPLTEGEAYVTPGNVRDGALIERALSIRELELCANYQTQYIDDIVPISAFEQRLALVDRVTRNKEAFQSLTRSRSDRQSFSSSLYSGSSCSPLVKATQSS